MNICAVAAATEDNTAIQFRRVQQQALSCSVKLRLRGRLSHAETDVGRRCENCPSLSSLKPQPNTDLHLIQELPDRPTPTLGPYGNSGNGKFTELHLADADYPHRRELSRLNTG